MKSRWKDRIRIMKPKAKTYDSWGHLVPTDWEIIDERWAHISFNLSNPVTALVTLRHPFDYNGELQIEWQKSLWQLIQGPLISPYTGIVQFKMEKLS